MTPSPRSKWALRDMEDPSPPPQFDNNQSEDNDDGGSGLDPSYVDNSDSWKDNEDENYSMCINGNVHDDTNIS